MKKESKVQKILMLILSFTLLTTSLLASTISRYVSEENAPFGKEEHLDYTVNSVFVVKNQEELFAAINQGYTYVQLDQNIENPLIVTQKAENLDADLILDLNGIEIQRNGYEPILNVKKGVRLTIVDTSAEQTGGLYNPVGSVFNITGGTLTVVTGTFESGPRYSEYYSYNTDVLSTSDPTKRTLVEDSAKKVCFYEKITKSDGTWYFSDPSEKEAPIIKSYPEKIGKVEYTHGNLYFDQTVTKGDLTINPDTYCYYRTSEDKAAEVNNEAAADWYYTYFVDPNNRFNYAAATVDPSEEENYVKITIYGYENTIKQAAADKYPNSDEDRLPKDYYAAIQMQDGTLDVQNGGFFSYFGVDKTACVNAQKGDLKIKKGKFSSRIPNAIRFDANDVIIKEDDEVAFEETYFDNYHWSNDAVGATYRGNLARQGESYCILNGGSANVTIGTGDLYSSNNGIINMQGGELSISGGTFYKRLTNGRVTVEEAEMSAIYMSQGALNISDAKCYVLRNDPLDVDGANGNENTHAICMKNGTLNVTDTTYYMEGDNSIGVKMESGKLAVTGGACEILGSNTYGIYSTVKGAGNFVVTNTSFALSGTSAENQTGIYAINSQVQVISNTATPSTISIIGTNGKGIHVQGSDSIVESTNYNYSLNGNSSRGIDIEAGKLTVNGGSCEIKGSNVYGIYSTVSGENNFYVENMPFTLTDGNTQTGIYARNGRVEIVADADKNAFISAVGTNSKGVHVGSGGSVISENYSYLLSGATSHGIYSTGGLVEISGGNITLDSNVSCYGVYASSTEAVDIKVTDATINVGYAITTNKTANSTNRASVGVFFATTNNANKITLKNTNIKCYEVGVLIDGGSLEVFGGSGTNEILTRKASSIIVLGGGITFDSSCNYDITSSTTINNATTNSFNITLPTIDEYTNRDYTNYDGIYVSGGDFISNGDVRITHTGLYNDTNYTTFVAEKIRSHAVKVLDGDVTIKQCNIVAEVGGGVRCEGGNIILGEETDKGNNDKITVNTNGSTSTNSRYNPNGVNYGEWQVYRNRNGGHAITLAGGKITIYGGTFRTKLGDAVRVEAGSAHEINIYDGIFWGDMAQADVNARKSGPGAYYGLKVMGAATVNIFNGTFDGGNGGAFITGIDTFTSCTNYYNSENKYANVLIYRGKFNTSENAKDGFTFYDAANVYFGAYKEGEISNDERATAIVINTGATSGCCLSASSLSRSSNNSSYDQRYWKKSMIYVYYGQYTNPGGTNSVWNSFQADSLIVYNTALGFTSISSPTQGGNDYGKFTIRNNQTARYYPYNG